MSNFLDFVYAHFGFIGSALKRIVPKFEDDIEAAGIKIYPEVFLSVVGLAAIISVAIPISLVALDLLSIIVIKDPIIYGLASVSPIIVILFGFVYPKLVASNRISGLKNEVPFASLYMSVMCSGGLSPYNSLIRLKNTDLLPHLKREIRKIEGIIFSLGLDPVSAMERAARVVHLREYKELLLGYVSILRSGGDVLHYLHMQTENLFAELRNRFKSMGDNMNVLMESYMIVGVLGALGLYMMFVVSFSLPTAGIGFTAENFFLFSFILLPFMSLLFIYFGDALQINYPTYQKKIYLTIALTLPLSILLLTQLVLPYFTKGIPVIHPFDKIIPTLKSIFEFEEGTEPALGMALSLSIILLPSIVTTHIYLKNERGIFYGLTTFIRDLVESRKMGLSPEKCIKLLSKRDYGKFSKHLKLINSKLNWGFSLHQIFEDLKKEIKSWLSLINLYLLIDTIEIGGGTEEGIETLARFSESLRLMEKERRSNLFPLLLVAYLGAILLTVTSIIFLKFFSSGGATGWFSIPYVTLKRVLLTPLIFHSFMIGLVAGKLVYGRISSGFLHSFLLILCAVIGIWVASHYSLLLLHI